MLQKFVLGFEILFILYFLFLLECRKNKYAAGVMNTYFLHLLYRYLTIIRIIQNPKIPKFSRKWAIFGFLKNKFTTCNFMAKNRKFQSSKRRIKSSTIQTYLLEPYAIKSSPLCKDNKNSKLQSSFHRQQS